ncbi:MAG: hypothetical protein L0Z50_34795 [Verrucomicrobiales bacterium]|nr:hypothetical protein [Verrucomicrobiales bacterium]
MRNLTRPFLIAVIMLATTALFYAYAACYTKLYQPQCAQPGDCFGYCTPIGCSTATCIQATGFGYEDWYNYRPGLGGYPSRYPTHEHNMCMVGSCRIYNNCTHAYESLPPGCSCSFATTVYAGNPGTCSEGKERY